MPSLFGRFWQRLRDSLWFVPIVIGLVDCGLTCGLIEFDSRPSFDGAKNFPLLFGVGAQGSRSMLTAVARSMLTVAALVFSLTLSTISQVSSQYSPRVLRNFMRDQGNQVVMGYFVGVFAYCLLPTAYCLLPAACWAPSGAPMSKNSCPAPPSWSGWRWVAWRPLSTSSTTSPSRCKPTPFCSASAAKAAGR